MNDSNTPAERSRPNPQRHRRQPSASAADPAPAAPKSRPQSMFIFPVQKAASEVTPAVASPGLVPPDGHRAKASPRRSSISDIVSRFESIGIIKPKATAVAPVPAVKPARLKLAPVSSPTAASARFPRISPPSSPAKPKAGPFDATLRVPRETNEYHEVRLNSPSPGGLPRVSPAGRRSPSPVRQPQPVYAKDMNPATRSELKPAITSSMSPSAQSPATSLAPPQEEAAPHSPSPERPFQGVSRLIDQWQKKSEEAENKGPGVGKSGASRFRREGIVSGGSKGS